MHRIKSVILILALYLRVSEDSMNEKNSEFLKHLHDEKLKTQDARTSYVNRKLIFATALLGAGSASTETFNLSILLYLVPFVTIAFDLYILGEDYSVKRIGGFLGSTSYDTHEKEWEKWVSKNRDPFALFSMPLLTTLVIIGAAAVLSLKNITICMEFFLLWLSIALLLSWGMSAYYLFYLRKRILKGFISIQNNDNSSDIFKFIHELRLSVKKSDYIITSNTYEETKHFCKYLLNNDALKRLKFIVPEYTTKEYFRCVEKDGTSLSIDNKIIEDFHRTVSIHPEFENWFKITTIIEINTPKTVFLIARWLCHLIGFRHISVHLFIDHPIQRDYTLIQVRGLNKFESPRCFDLPVAGHVAELDSEETTLLKELKEELNLNVSDIDIQRRFGSYEFKESTDIVNIEFRIIYKCIIKEDSLSKIRFGINEVAAISIFSIWELKKLIEDFSNSVASGLRESYPMYLRNRLTNKPHS